MLSLEQGGGSLYIHGHHSVWVIDTCRNSELNLEQHDSYFVHYSGISLLWTLLGQLKMSRLVRCPQFRIVLYTTLSNLEPRQCPE